MHLSPTIKHNIKHNSALSICCTIFDNFSWNLAQMFNSLRQCAQKVCFSQSSSRSRKHLKVKCLNLLFLYILYLPHSGSRSRSQLKVVSKWDSHPHHDSCEGTRLLLCFSLTMYMYLVLQDPAQQATLGCGAWCFSHTLYMAVYGDCWPWTMCYWSWNSLTGLYGYILAILAVYWSWNHLSCLNIAM